MTKNKTTVEITKFPVKISRSDKVCILGSCFANEIGARMKGDGFDVCINPFGTLFNPVSIANSIARLDSAIPFRKEECVEMGAGAGKICSWWHHTSFARLTAEEFLENANSALAEASAAWKESNKVILTFGTAMVWKLINSGEIVSIAHVNTTPKNETDRKTYKAYASINADERVRAGMSVILYVSSGAAAETADAHGQAAEETGEAHGHADDETVMEETVETAVTP